MIVHGHRIHDVGGHFPILVCKDCRVDYLDLDEMGFPPCQKVPSRAERGLRYLATLRQKTSAHVAGAQLRLRQAWLWARFGTITETVKSVDGGVASEIEYRGRGDKIVGYWAYGSFDPAFPYQG